MATKKTLQRKKPGYTKSGDIRIVSLAYGQLADLLTKTTKKKTAGKIRNRMRILELRPGFVAPAVEQPAEAQV